MNAGLQQQDSWSNLNALFGQSKTAASGLWKSGDRDLDMIRQYFGSLVGGDRTATAEAVAPAANAIRAGGDAARNEHAAMGTARTGGTAAANQQGEDAVRAQIDSLVGQLRSGAAHELKGISDTELNAMMSALGLSAGAAGTSGSLAGADVASRRAASSAMWSSLIGGGAKLAAAFI